MYIFEFLANAYWTVDEQLNAAYIRTVGEENAESIITKIDVMTVDPRWNQDIVMINDYEDVSTAKLSTKDILKVTRFQESVEARIKRNKWYFLASKLIHYGIIRMYTTYINDPSNPKMFVYRKIKHIKNDRLRRFASECRYDCRLFEKLTNGPKK